jgi:putative endonuclease
MTKYYYLYIMASESGTLYIGMTNNLGRRVWEHKNNEIDGFTKKYNCNKLVYYEYGQDVNGTIAREKQLKKWNRKKKEVLIKSINPRWSDLSKEMFGFKD